MLTVRVVKNRIHELFRLELLTQYGLFCPSTFSSVSLQLGAARPHLEHKLICAVTCDTRVVASRCT